MHGNMYPPTYIPGGTQWIGPRYGVNDMACHMACKKDKRALACLESASQGAYGHPRSSRMVCSYTHINKLAPYPCPLYM
jgi:hypothetical protein